MSDGKCPCSFTTKKLLLLLILLPATLIYFQRSTSCDVSSPARIETPPTHSFMTHDKLYEILYGNKSDMHSVLTSANVRNQYYDLIRSYMTGPNMSKPVNLKSYNRADWLRDGVQTNHVLKQLSGRRNGFFIESGALDGEVRSTTLYLEMNLNWTGLLIEPDPATHKMLLTKNRRAIVFNGCLSPTRYSKMTTFLGSWWAGGIVDHIPKKQFEKEKINGKFHEVRCFPLEDVLSAINVSHIDFWNLDVEGAEADILATVDWDRTTIDIVGVEPHDTTAIATIRRLMTENGRYREFVSTDLAYSDLMYERLK